MCWSDSIALPREKRRGVKILPAGRGNTKMSVTDATVRVMERGGDEEMTVACPDRDLERARRLAKAALANGPINRGELIDEVARSGPYYRDTVKVALASLDLVEKPDGRVRLRRKNRKRRL